MASESDRLTARKRIVLPNGHSVFIPVITRISFIDPYDRYQETQYTVENSAKSKRTVHVDTVHSTGDPTKTIPVERVDFWPLVDPVSRGQESVISFDNKTGAGSTPPHFSTHLKTHVVRYYKDPDDHNDDGSWVDSELIDSFSVTDPYDRYQETIFQLANTDNQANPDDPEITDTANGIDPPYRADPFQNIVDFNCEETATGEAPVYWYVWLQTQTYPFYNPLDMTTPIWAPRGFDSLELGIDSALAIRAAYSAWLEAGDFSTTPPPWPPTHPDAHPNPVTGIPGAYRKFATEAEAIASAAAETAKARWSYIPGEGSRVDYYVTFSVGSSERWIPYPELPFG